MWVNGINLDQIRKIEKGSDGVRVTWATGEKEFIEGQLGFDIWQEMCVAEARREAAE